MKHIPLLFLMLFLLICIPSCKKQNVTESPTADTILNKYISQYSKHFIKSTDPIEIVFKDDYVSSDFIGSKVSPDAISIKPYVNGEFLWNSTSEIQFKPEGRLENGKQYSIRINLKKLSDFRPIEKDETLVLTFEVVPQSLSISFQPLQSETDDSFIIHGELSSNDVIEKNSIVDLIKIKSAPNSDIAINWEQKSNSSLDFAISNIVKQDKAIDLILNWGGSTIDEKFKGEKEFKIPAKGDFNVIDVVTQGSNKIIIVCSGILSEKQNLSGLIRINNANADYQYEIENNFIFVYLKQTINVPFEIKVEKSIKNNKDQNLADNYQKQLSFDPLKPELQSERTGIIVPTEGKIIVPFKARNLKYVDVEVFKVYSDNVLQFLQYNNLNDYIGDRVVGKVVHEEKVDLSELDNSSNVREWIRYAIDLNQFVQADLGAMYRVRIGFKHGYHTELNCENEIAESTIINDGTYGLEAYGNDYSEYRYQERDNPCHRSYYMSDRFVQQNIFASNIGLIAKGGNNGKEWNVFTTNLRTAGPLPKTEVSFYDFQQQLIASRTSDNNGKVTLSLDSKPSFVVANFNGEFGYLNVQESYSNSLSDFGVSGFAKKDGIDGLIYGERGVWRPGDTVFLSFMLFDQNATNIEQQPVVFEVTDARGKTVYRSNAQYYQGNIYSCHVPTQENAPTGDWTAKVTVGNLEYTKTLKIETVKPNRLKIELTDLDNEIDVSSGKSDDLKIIGSWLHGAKANGLRAQIEAEYNSVSTKFKGFNSFVFDDPARDQNFRSMELLDNKLDENGAAVFNFKISKNVFPQGKLRASVKSRIYEKSGNFSEDYSSTLINPYSSYVGIEMPKSKWGSTFIQSEKEVKVPVVVVDKTGKPINGRKVTVGLYQSEWNWWYNRSYNRMYEFNSSTHKGALETSSLITDENGKAFWSPKLVGYGNYLVRVCDTESGHCTGSLFYSSKWGYADNDINSPKTFLLSSDKTNYTVGDKIKVKIPSNENAQVLLTIERSNNVVESFWVECDKEETEITIEASEDMFPNAYVHAMLIQPYDEHNNDLPLRLYGVLPISINDSSKKLLPEIKMKSELKPTERFQIEVSEKEGREMNYTIAIVDEGLLSLTRFNTPSPYDRFYGKQALNLNTWDIFDFVASGYEKGIMNTYSIGGDGVVVQKGEAKANRFKPVVTYKGPFKLNKNASNNHEFEMENYVGEVRVMVVAGNSTAYGNAEKSVPVRKELMVNTTMPRVLAPGESTNLGVNVFALSDKISSVDLSVESTGSNEKPVKYYSNISFNKSGDKVEYFPVSVGDDIGVNSYKVQAKSDAFSAEDLIEINVQNPNPFETKTIDFVIEKNSKKSIDYKLLGMNGTNEVKIQLYSLPSFNLEKRLQYLVRYPYGCIEQTVSKAYAQLFLDDISEISGEYKTKIKHNINGAIKRLASFQKSSGGFSFWPGSMYTDDWGSIYVGDFIYEAKGKGYFVNNETYNSWLAYEKKKASIWDSNSSIDQELVQAYRLYVLAKCGNAEIGAMNRLRKNKFKSSTSAYLLATAYAMIGQNDVAEALVKASGKIDSKQNDYRMSYGSSIRDESLVMLYYIYSENDIESMKILRKIASDLSSNRWYSTQSSAMALLSIAKYVKGRKSKGLKGSFQNSGKGRIQFNTNKTTFTRPLFIADELTLNHNVEVVNEASENMYGQVIISGQPLIGEESQSNSKHVSLNIEYVDKENNKIDVSNLKQGMDFYAVCSVKHQNTKPYQLENLALSFKLPSGWEINNERMSGLSSTNKDSSYDYKDIKDSSVDVFFDLRLKETKQFSFSLTSTFAGRFYLPASVCQSMYEGEVSSTIKGKWIDIR